MGKTTPVSEEEEIKIVKAIKNNGKRNELARKFKRSASTITKIANKNNLSFDRSATKKASEAFSFYNKEKRMGLLKIAFEKAKELIQESAQFTTNDMRNISTSLGILIDKQRLEEGEPTEISKSDVKNTNAVNIDDISNEDIEILAEKIREERETDHQRK